MSVKLPSQDLTSAVVGFSNNFDWNTYVQIRSEAMPPQDAAHVRVFNDTGCALDVRFTQSGGTKYIPPGGWPVFTLKPGDTGLTYTVEKIIPGQQIANLAAVYYFPGEEVDDTGPLGNSPVGVGGTVTTTPMTSSDIVNKLVTPGVLSGIQATKDGSVANQLDVTSGTAIVQQSSGALTLVNPGATTFLTSVPSTTYFLDLNSDGTYSWATTHSTDPNALALYFVTTNGSGQISAVNFQGNFGVINVLGSDSEVIQWGGAGSLNSFPNGASFQNSVGLLGTPAVSNVGGMNTAGNLGIPPIVASAYEQHVTGTGAVTIVTFTPTANGLYRVSGFVRVNNGTSNNNCKLQVTFFDPQKAGGTSDFSYMVGINGLSGAGVQFGGSTGISNNPYALEPQVFDCTANKALTVAYTDPTNTPSDWVSIIVERLS